MHNKVFSVICLLFLMVFVSGCAGHYEVLKEHQKTQQELIKAQYGAGEYYHPEKEKPKIGDTFNIELDDQQRVKAMSVNVEPLLLAMRAPERRVTLADIGPPPEHIFTKWWKDTLYSPVASAFVYIWGATQIADTISDGAGHNTTNNNSGNTGSYNQAGGGQAVSTGTGAATFDASSIDRSNHSLNDAYNDKSTTENTSINDSYNDSSNNSDNSQKHDEAWNDSHDQNWQDSGNVDNRNDYNNPDNRYDYDNPDNRYDYENPVTDYSSSP